MMLKIGATNGQPMIAFGVDESLRFMKEAGFDGVDYALNVYQDDEDYILDQSEDAIKAYFTHVRELCEELHLEVYQTHAPLYFGGGMRGEDPSIFWSDRFRKIYSNALRATKYLGCKYCVVHPIILDDYDNVFLKNLEVNVNFYSMLKPVIKETGVMVAIENMDGLNRISSMCKRPCPTACSSGEKINYLIDRLGEGFCACLDTGHCYLSGNNPAGMARILNGNLKVLHLQDSDGYDDIHVIPTCANVDWEDLCRALAEISFDGMLNFEVNLFRTSEKREVMLAESKLMVEIGKEFAEKIEAYRGAAQNG